MFRVLLTRSPEDNQRLLESLDGVETESCPMLQISGLLPTDAQRRLIQDLDLFDHIIFVSRNAARFGVNQLGSYWPAWPLAPSWYAVGSATRDVLAEFGIDCIAPQEESTAGLLGLASLSDVRGERVLIVRGQDGLPTLGESLAARGARVEYLEVYRRAPVTLPPETQAHIINSRPWIVVAFSGDAVKAFAANVGEVRDGFVIVAPSGRIADIATANGFAAHAADGTAQGAIMAKITEILAGGNGQAHGDW